MKRLQLLLMAVLAGVSFSCQKLVTNVDLPKVAPELVLFGFISPEDSVIKVQVSLSKPVFGKQSSGNMYDFVKDAIVTITNDGGQSVTLNYTDSVNAYTVSGKLFAIEPGRTYTAIAQTASKNAKATCTVPLNVVNFTELTYRKFNNNGSFNGPDYRILYKWNDEPGKVNYYRTVSQAKAVNDPMNSGYYDLCGNLFDDENQGGKTITSDCEVYSYYSDTSSSRSVDALVFLLNTDVHYYEYHRRRIDYFGDDPFSESFPQYSNVQGGLGVFCAYRKAQRNITLQ